MTLDSRSTNPEDQPPQPPVTYQSYLLRLWHEAGSNTPWRAMLESVTEPGERQNFSDLESLFAFLRVKAD